LKKKKKAKDQKNNFLVNYSNPEAPEFNIFFLAIIGTILVVISFIILLVVRSKRKSRINGSESSDDDKLELSQNISRNVKLQRTKSKILAREALEMSLKRLKKNESGSEKEPSSEKLDEESEKKDSSSEKVSEKKESSSEKQSSKSKKQSKSESSSN
jgi:hypothetical protein